MSNRNGQIRALIGWPALLLSVVILCAAVLWLKLDAIDRHLAAHHQPAHTHSESVLAHAMNHHAGPSDGGSIHAVDEIPHQHGPFHESSHPPSGKLSLVPEWAPGRMLAIALPKSRAGDDGYRRIVADLAETCLTRTALDLVLVLGQNDVSSLAAFDQIVEQRELDRDRIHHCETKALDSVWLRDYGPIFVRRENDRQMFVIDLAYRDLRVDTDMSPELASSLRPNDDLAPIYFATLLDQPLVHPGLVMNGGDLYTDGRSTLYTSKETLHLNSGDRDYLAEAFRLFFGVERVHYLSPLPGPTVKHIDMAFKLVAPDICIVGTYGDGQGDADLVAVQRVASQILDRNAAYLTEQGLRVIRMPMPDITRMTRWEYYGHVFSEEDRQLRIAETASAALVSVDAIRQRLLSTYVYTYRTFVNSVLVVSRATGSKGHTEGTPDHRLLIVPRYDIPEYAQLEQEVRRAYSRAYGEQVEIVFVEAEAIAHGNGSLRCLICQLPGN